MGSFSHKDHKETDGNYSLKQNNAGRTKINSASNQVVHVSTNDENNARVTGIGRIGIADEECPFWIHSNPWT